MLTTINPKLLTYKTELLTIDILGGVDLHNLERLVCTLRISYQNYPPFRTTLDLYNDNQTDKLQRTLCDKWQLKLLEVSSAISSLTDALESFRLNGQAKPVNEFQMNQTDKENALNLLKNTSVLDEIYTHLNLLGILEEKNKIWVLWMALCSHKSQNPFSVLCLNQKNRADFLQILSECLPLSAFTYHSRFSPNAWYYFDSNQLQNKVLFLEDLPWTDAMLTPLSILQTQGRLLNTRATKNKEGMIHSTTFQVKGRFCLLACANGDKTQKELPFLCLDFDDQNEQAFLDYQKQKRAGHFSFSMIEKSKRLLKCITQTLEPVGVINPFAPLIDLPNSIKNTRQNLTILLNFIEAISFFHQHQREKKVNEQTGEIFVLTAKEDIKLAFDLLKTSLFRKADELSSVAREFHTWLNSFLEQAKTDKFTAFDIRKETNIHPRKLNRYLNELKYFSYLQIIGGNKHREGFIYKITQFGTQEKAEKEIENQIQMILNKIDEKETEKPKKEPQPQENQQDKPQNSIHDFLETINQPFTSDLVAQKLGLSDRNTRRQLKILTEKGFLNRKRVGNGYQYNKAVGH
jgi:hypothetical protein